MGLNTSIIFSTTTRKLKQKSNGSYEYTVIARDGKKLKTKVEVKETNCKDVRDGTYFVSDYGTGDYFTDGKVLEEYLEMNPETILNQISTGKSLEGKELRK